MCNKLYCILLVNMNMSPVIGYKVYTLAQIILVVAGIYFVVARLIISPDNSSFDNSRTICPIQKKT